MRHRFLAIEGNIGTGKSSLAMRIAKDAGMEYLAEEFEENSFLRKFYNNPAQYAFPLEMSFLADRFNQLKRKLFQPGFFSGGIVSDYIFFKCLVFSKVNLNEDEYQLYIRLFEIINMQIPAPDLMVYLHKSPELLIENIIKRGREYELKITPEYLKNIQEEYFLYMKQITRYPLLIIDTHGLDFVNKESDYLYLKNLINNSYKNGITYISNDNETQSQLFLNK